VRREPLRLPINSNEGRFDLRLVVLHLYRVAKLGAIQHPVTPYFIQAVATPSPATFALQLPCIAIEVSLLWMRACTKLLRLLTPVLVYSVERLFQDSWWSWSEVEWIASSGLARYGRGVAPLTRNLA